MTFNVGDLVNVFYLTMDKGHQPKGLATIIDPTELIERYKLPSDSICYRFHSGNPNGTSARYYNPVSHKNTWKLELVYNELPYDPKQQCDEDDDI